MIPINIVLLVEKLAFKCILKQIDYVIFAMNLINNKNWFWMKKWKKHLEGKQVKENSICLEMISNIENNCINQIQYWNRSFNCKNKINKFQFSFLFYSDIIIFDEQ